MINLYAVRCKLKTGVLMQYTTITTDKEKQLRNIRAYLRRQEIRLIVNNVGLIQSNVGGFYGKSN